MTAATEARLLLCGLARLPPPPFRFSDTCPRDNLGRFFFSRPSVGVLRVIFVFKFS